MLAFFPALQALEEVGTVHGFQGRTVDNVIAVMEANHPNLTTRKSFYVEISRARHKAELVTGDAKALREQLEAVTSERIAALEAIEPAVDRAAAQDGGRNRGAALGVERAASPLIAAARPDSFRNAVDVSLQIPRQHFHHRGNQRLQFRQAISRGQHDDDRDRQRIGVLLMLDAAVDGDHRIEALAGGKRQQAAVSRCRSSPSPGPCEA